ncbi:hypothetical protein PFICI_00085 [Pestalotiopsis fici W106-1]|uniref:Uncharacterized protein n=1 Tax=Pestalotiopsis fici (strain W106-1 / CGMCC3.15140) TaxID=1229662 RepID=W3XLC9_PESFW|nr:uncharacterized protein PFICI_00085 [Pestalotiopsis fici W106-1]ETS86257.1 hypothetical protein PFICI_00085 [Pestalotiopsis fici W106-1]
MDTDQSSSEPRVTESRRRNRMGPRDFGPPKAFEIPPELYQKAKNQNDELNDDEVHRGDVVGKALAHPESLTLAEKYDVLGWTEPESLHAAIQRISGLETPAELLAKAQVSRDSLSWDEIDLIVKRFQLSSPTPGTSGVDMWRQVPGNLQARALVSACEGIDDEFFNRLTEFSIGDDGAVAKRVAKFLKDNPEALPPQPSIRNEHCYSLAHSRDDVVLGNYRPWPPLGPGRFPEQYPPTASVVFGRDLKEQGIFSYAPVGRELYQLWDDLSEDERDQYRDRAEVLRQAAWDEWYKKQGSKQGGRDPRPVMALASE